MCNHLFIGVLCAGHAAQRKIENNTCFHVGNVLFLGVLLFNWFMIFFFFLQVVTNCKNTVQGFKRFHGRAFSDPYVQRLKNSLVYDIVQMPTGTTGIKVREA